MTNGKTNRNGTQIMSCLCDPDTGGVPAEGPVGYHETQSFNMCGKHALNNLLQRPAFSKQQLDQICFELTPTSTFSINPHKSILRGDYDANVLMVALQSEGKELRWHDRRQPVAEADLEGAFALILNKDNSSLLWSSRHWLAIRRMEDGRFWNLDSKLAGPRLIGDRAALEGMVEEELAADGQAELLLVYDQPADPDGAAAEGETDSAAPGDS